MEAKDKVYRSRKKIMLDNFLGGIAWGVGSAIGAVLLIAFLGFIVAKLNVIPIIGDFVAEVSKYAQQKQFQENVQEKNQ